MRIAELLAEADAAGATLGHGAGEGAIRYINRCVTSQALSVREAATWHPPSRGRHGGIGAERP